MDILIELFSITNLILCLAIVALVFIQRKATELFFLNVFKKDIKKNNVWSELLVPVGPIGTACGLMMIPGVPVMAMFASTIGAKLVFGLGMGLVSNLAYRLVKKNVLDKMGKEDEEPIYTDK